MPNKQAQGDTQAKDHPKILSRTMSTPCADVVDWQPHNPSIVRNNLEARKLLQADQIRDGEQMMMKTNSHALDLELQTLHEDREHLLTIDETEDYPIEFTARNST